MVYLGIVTRKRRVAEMAPMEAHLATVLESIADGIGDRPAISQGDVELSWRELDERAARLASVLADAGVSPGDTVGLYLHNCPEYLETWLAAFKIRAIPVNINYRYVADELEYLLDDCGARVLVHSAELSEPVAAVLARRPMDLVVCAGSSNETLPKDAASYSDVVSAAEPHPRIERSSEDHQLLYTGGTTGMPKGVVYRIGGVVLEVGRVVAPLVGATEVPADAAAVVRNAITAARSGASLVTLLLPPLMHGTGLSMALATLATGGTVVLDADAGFDARAALAQAEESDASMVVVVGDAFARPLLVEARRRTARGEPVELGSLRLVMSSGAMLSEETKAGLLELAPQAMVVDMLASSEGPMGTSLSTAAGGPQTTMFTPREGTVVLDECDQVVPAGSDRIGRVAVPGDNPIGYHNDPKKTAETFREIDGVRYVLPGDWAAVEPDGTLRLLGRGSHCINTGGEKVFPEEVEEVLKSHPEVLDALVFGVEDDRWGQRIEAVVSSCDGSCIDERILDSHLRDHLAGYKAPKRLTQLAVVPRAPNGKADYAAARSLAAEAAQATGTAESSGGTTKVAT